MNALPQIRIGSRASALARWQSHWVAQQLENAGVTTEIVWITTTGDVTKGPIGAASEPGLFTKEIQRALLMDQIDLAVHSLKDLPTEPIDGLVLAAVPPRESCGDALVSPRATSIESLPPGSTVGTGSARRRAQLLHWRPDLVMVEMRGNVDSRLRKLDEGLCDAIILAQAGLKRLDLSARITALLPFEKMLPAVGQGALGLETRASDDRSPAVLTGIDDPVTRTCVLAERAMLAELRGGCLAPVAAWARPEENGLKLEGAVLSLDGCQRLAAAGTCPLNVSAAIELGIRVAGELLDQGAAQLIASARPA